MNRALVFPSRRGEVARWTPAPLATVFLAAAQALLAKHDAVARSIAVAGGFAEEAASALAPFMDEARTAPLAAALADAARFAAARSS